MTRIKRLANRALTRWKAFRAWMQPRFMKANKRLRVMFEREVPVEILSELIAHGKRVVSPRIIDEYMYNRGKYVITRRDLGDGIFIREVVEKWVYSPTGKLEEYTRTKGKKTKHYVYNPPGRLLGKRAKD